MLLQLACLHNCSCNAYSYSNGDCSIWYGELLNLQEQYKGSGGGTLFLHLSASEFPSFESNKRVVIGGIIGGSVGNLVLFAVISLVTQRRKRIGMMGVPKVAEDGLIAFRYSYWQHVSNNYSEKLGGGGFGKGLLPDSTPMAMKKLEGFHQGENQFHSEVSTIVLGLLTLFGFIDCARKGRTNY